MAETGKKWYVLKAVSGKEGKVKEYIEALAFNSQPNRYFGFTVNELNEHFQGTKYVFTLGVDGQTIVVPMETVNDDIYVKAMEDVLIGTGVILICVTVSVVAAPAAPAVGMIFAASASTGTAFALESGAISFAAAAIAKGYETESFEQAMKAGVDRWRRFQMGRNHWCCGWRSSRGYSTERCYTQRPDNE